MNHSPTEFLAPRFVGPRFEDHTIPLEILKDIAVLEEMIVEVAKWRYLRENPQRQRVPRGFANGISLKLSTNIEPGSAIPKIVLSMTSAVMQLFPLEEQRYVIDARDNIIAAINAAENDDAVADYLTSGHLEYFDRIGRSLREDESIEFDHTNQDHPARLNKRTRRKLLECSQIEEMTEEVALRGTVPAINHDKAVFEMNVLGGRRISAPMTSLHRDNILKAVSHYHEDAPRILVRGVGRYSRDGRLLKLDSVEHVSFLDANDVAARLDEFRSLKRGWLDGKGLAPKSECLDRLSQLFDANFPENLPLPYVYPTPEGGVQFEWSQGDKELSLEIEFPKFISHWHCLDLRTQQDSERTVELSKAEGWEWIVKQFPVAKKGESR